jgi:hypothetical protein
MTIIILKENLNLHVVAGPAGRKASCLSAGQMYYTLPRLSVFLPKLLYGLRNPFVNDRNGLLDTQLLSNDKAKGIKLHYCRC